LTAADPNAMAVKSSGALADGRATSATPARHTAEAIHTARPARSPRKRLAK
jgi:hypothetical protein